MRGGPLRQANQETDTLCPSALPTPDHLSKGVLAHDGCGRTLRIPSSKRIKAPSLYRTSCRERDLFSGGMFHAFWTMLERAEKRLYDRIKR